MMKWVEAGRGMVDWTQVNETLTITNYKGVLLIPCGYKRNPNSRFLQLLKEVKIFLDVFKLCN